MSKHQHECGCGHDHHEHDQKQTHDNHDHDHKNHDHDHSGHDHDHNHNHPDDFTSETIPLTGLHCGDCAAKLEKAVSKIEGVDQVEVRFATSKMRVGYDASKVKQQAIFEKVRGLGYDVDPSYFQQSGKKIFRIEGMDCADCAQKLEKRVGSIKGVETVSVNYGAAKMTVEYDGDSQEIVHVVKQAGYTAEEQVEGKRYKPKETSFWRGNQKAVTTLFSGILFLLAWGLSFTDLLSVVVLDTIYAASMIVGGYRIAKSGLYGLKSKIVGTELLMTIAGIGAAAIGQWAEGAAVVFLFSLGETLEAFTMDRTRKSIRSLMDLAPDEALVRRSGSTMTLPVEDIRIGDILIVKPGEKVAMDGRLTKGYTTINQAPITGESIPVEKNAGDDVFAGTINQQGAIEVEVTKLAKDNTLARIIEMVEEAQAQKAPSQRFVDVFAKYYTPAVIVIAILIAAIPPLFFGQEFAPWFYRALVMLVVSCPCALVISTPVSIVSAIGNAAKNGVLIKGGAHLERLGALSVIAFDKTGTLTEGIPQVTNLQSLSDRSEGEIMRIAASIEASSEHPLAKAITRYTLKNGIQWPECSDFQSITGKGAEASVDGEKYYIGNPRLFTEVLQLDLGQWSEAISTMQGQGKTVMLIGRETELLGMIGVADQVRENSRSTIASLKAVGIKEAYMLTGDNEGTARAIASQIGGIEYKAELLPEDKVTAVKELMSKKGQVAMVGDGINDAPALATSTVGIAMGAAGTDTALETADVALMSDDLSKIPYTITLSRRALSIIKQNIGFSLIVKAVFLAMIIPGWATLWMAVLADTGASLIVILNGMRLLRTQQQNRTNRPTPDLQKVKQQSAQVAANS